MRFMMLMIPKAYSAASADARPDLDAVKRMMKYNEELTKAGVLLALDGLHPPAAGVRVRYPKGKPQVTDGPFAEAKEVLGGYWMLEAESKEELVKWAQRCPALKGDVIEIRQIFDCASLANKK